MSFGFADSGLRRRRWPRAFTLLELLAVIAIIALLAGVVIGTGRHAAESSRVGRATAELAALSAALENYRRHHGDYPRIASDISADDVNAGRSLHAALTGWRGPERDATNFETKQIAFIESAKFTLAAPDANPDAPNHLLDPWGQPYRYAYNTRANGWLAVSFVLMSAGPNREATLPLPADGIMDATYDAELIDGRAVNIDNLHANRN